MTLPQKEEKGGRGEIIMTEQFHLCSLDMSLVFYNMMKGVQSLQNLLGQEDKCHRLPFKRDQEDFQQSPNPQSEWKFSPSKH